MNIQEEAEKRYPEPDQDRTGQQADRRSAFKEGAEWAQEEAVAEYISTKEIPKVQIEFTNQPAFDTFTRETKAEARKEALRDAIESLERFAGSQENSKHIQHLRDMISAEETKNAL